jgi:catechol 2,3-dioxygenase-like lactoylglutathione lyase family enzyme
MTTVKIEVVHVPVTDVDRAKAFYVDTLGFNADHDQVVNPELRFVQVTPPGSACSIAFGKGLNDMEPGSQRGIMAVIPDAEAEHKRLVGLGVECSEIDHQPWGDFIYFKDPDGNAWTLQQLPEWSRSDKA